MSREITSQDLVADPPLIRRPTRSPRWRGLRWHIRWPLLASIALAAGVHALVLADITVPFAEPAMSFWFLIMLPVYLLFTTPVWGGAPAAERLGFSLTSVLLALMLAGLVANTLLPHIGVPRPLAPTPILVIGDLLNVCLFLFRQWRPQADHSRKENTWRAWFRAIGREEARLLVGSVLFVALAILGTNRLNNGAGNQASLAGLGISAVTLILLLGWQRRLREGIICATLYFLSLGLLLMTSLRGWYVTGHDIQTEYQVFQLTELHARWAVSGLHTAYSACLSLTILPTELGQLIHVESPYIYKFFFQVIFATCPALVYPIARRYWPRLPALLAAVYFISFPTFFNDMPFLNRQEIALLFVCVGVLSIINTTWSLRRRQIALVAASIGVEISHYSSMYLWVATLLAAWVAWRMVKLVHRDRSRRTSHAQAPPWVAATRTVSIVPIVAAAAIAVAWGYAATQSANTLLTDVKSSISAVVHHSSSARSATVGYSLLVGRTPSPESVLKDYRLQALELRTETPKVPYLPAQIVYTYKTPVAKQPLLPLTEAGRLLKKAGVPVAGLNSALRIAAAGGEQIFLAVGLISILLMRRFHKQVGLEFYCLGIGSTLLIAAMTVLPDLSVDYGVLRVFEGALILIAPVIVTGSAMLFRPLGESWAFRVASAICVAIYISTSGLMPQLLGGYQPQLNLNNSGLYYNSYYVHPQEESAIGWLSERHGIVPYGMQASYAPDRFLFTTAGVASSMQYIPDIFPLLVHEHTWVLLDYSTVRNGNAVTSFDGDLIPYKYPIRLLHVSKNLVYDNGGAEVYR
jgi:uncharacterized membrane protein